MRECPPAEAVRRAIRIYLLTFFGISALTLLYFAAVVHKIPGHLFFLGAKIERFGDLIRFTAKPQHWKDPLMIDGEHLLGSLYPRNYPPLSVLIYIFLLQAFAPYSVLALLGVFFGGVALGCVLLWKRVRRSPAAGLATSVSIFATGLLGWGSLQVAMRGNIEGWMWIAVAAGAWLLARKRDVGAAVCFGIAMCIKPYPVLWLLLLARHRRWKAAAAGVVSYAVVTLVSLLAINPNPMRAYDQISAKSNFFSDYIACFRPIPEMLGDHSLLQTMKTISRVVRNHGLTFEAWDYTTHPSDDFALTLYHAYLPIGIGLGLLVLWRVWNKPVLNQVFALAAITTTLPLVAGDYTLTVILIPMAAFLVFLMEDVAAGTVSFSVGKMLWFLLPCAIVNAMLPLENLHGVIKCAALLVLMGAASVIPMPGRVFELSEAHAQSTAAGAAVTHSREPV